MDIKPLEDPTTGSDETHEYDSALSDETLKYDSEDSTDRPAVIDDEPMEPIAPVQSEQQGRLQRFWQVAHTHKKASIPLGIIVLLLILLAIPPTRYPIIGSFYKKQYQVKVVDAQTNNPVSAATITIAGKMANTNNQGIAHVKVAVGNKQLAVTKKYYTTNSVKVLVPILTSGISTFKLIATGRQVPVTIVNKITGKPVSDATISAAGTSIHTDKNGTGMLVLPADKASLTATLSAAGYNSQPATVQITTNVVPN